MAVDSRSSLSWDYLNRAMWFNFSRSIGSNAPSKDCQLVLDHVALLSDAFISHGIKVLLSGSIADGTWVHPILRDNTSEIDIMCILKRLRIRQHEQRSMFYEVPSAPGFIWLHVPETVRVKSIVQDKPFSIMTLKKVRNTRGEVEHFLVARDTKIANHELFSSKHRVNLLNKFGGLISNIIPDLLGSQSSLFVGDVGKKKGSAAFKATLEVQFQRLQPQLRNNPGQFLLTNILPKLIEGFIEQRDAKEEEEESEAAVMVPFNSTNQESQDLYNEYPRPRSNSDDEPNTPVTSSADYEDESDNASSEEYKDFVGSFDLVPAIECEGWPLIARSFISRQRKWPPPELLRKITQGGFHLVAKCSPKGNKEMEWRISFSLAEMTLFQNMSEFQRKCYKVFKAIYYSELTRPRVLCSYYMKTIFLWACERLPEEYWAEDRLAQIVMGLLDDLIHCLVTMSCPHYFIPENDQFAHVPEEFLLHHARTVSKIRTQPDRYPSKETQRLLCRGISADGGSEVVQDEDDEITVPTQPTRADSYYSQDEIDLD